MKKYISVILALLLIITNTSCGFAQGTETAKDDAFELVLQIDNPMMTVNNVEKEIDEGRGTAPIIKDGRTLVPIRAIIEAMGGSVLWDNETNTALLALGDDEMRLTIGSKTAYFNDEENTLDALPEIIGERTMLPIRFIAEKFKFMVKWNEATKEITITRQDGENPEPTITDETADENGKILIVYFSRAGENYGVGTVEIGNTAVVAGFINDALNGSADTFEIVPEEPYPTGYEDTKTRATREKNDNARPEFVGEIDDIAEYDTVFIGYPMWYGQMPMIMYTFLEKYNMAGKTIIPFQTHGGSGWGSTRQAIQELCPDANVLENGFSVSGTQARSAESNVKEWVDELELNVKAEGEAMTLMIDEKEYNVNWDDNVTASDIKNMLPLSLTLERYADHEFYAELPKTPQKDKNTTSQIKAGHIYYWDGWNAFVINYEDYDISPYKVVHIGEITDKTVIDALIDGNDSISVNIK